MSITLLHVCGNLLELVFGGNNSLGKELAGGLVGGRCGSDLLSGGVVDLTLLGLALLSWEEDELGFVGGESLDVELELLLTGGGSSVVNGDTDSSGEFLAKLGTSKLGESEATAISDLTGVSASARGDNRSQLLKGSGEHFSALAVSTLHSSKLLGWLVEVNSDSGLPVLAEMYVWDDVVVLDHC